MTTTISTNRTIDLSQSLADITSNLIHDSEHHLLPSDLFENVLFEVIEDLIDDFALNPNQYLQPKHHDQINQIAEEYLNS